MGVDVGNKLEPPLFELRDRVGMRRLDPIDLSGQKRSGPRICFWNWNEHVTVELGGAFRISIISVLHEFGPRLARHETIEPPGTGSRRVSCECLPALAYRVELRGLEMRRKVNSYENQLSGVFVCELDRQIARFFATIPAMKCDRVPLRIAPHQTAEAC